MSTLGPLIIDLAQAEQTEQAELSATEKERLLHPSVGGVILFARHFRSRQQITELCHRIHELRPLLITVDHEGGRVQRFREGFTAIPPMAAIGHVWERDVFEGMQTATAAGFVLASELRACGVDLSFTPVLDLDHGHSDVIGDRAFHQNKHVVTLLAQCLMHGLAQAGMSNCGKHFPGHGFVEADSHVDMPVDRRDLVSIMQEDAFPYQYLSMYLDAVMPAHVIYEEVDHHPAGFSKHWCRYLRQQCTFDGVIISDDLDMQGAKIMGDIHARVNAARAAGCDMTLICNAPKDADRVLSSAPLQISAQTQARIQKLLPRGQALSWSQLQKDARYQKALHYLQLCS